MFKTEVKKIITVEAAIVWDLLSNFGEIGWVPGFGDMDIVVKGSGPGMQRVIPGPSGPCVEQLDEIDPENMVMRYSFVSGLPLPVINLAVCVTVTETAPGACQVVWHCQAMPNGVSEDEAVNVIDAFYFQLASVVENEVRKRQS